MLIVNDLQTVCLSLADLLADLFILVSGCLSIVLGPCFLMFADIFNHTNLLLVTIMMRSMGLMADIPYGSFECKWPLWALLLWYLVLSAAAIWLHSRHPIRDNKTGRAPS